MSSLINQTIFRVISYNNLPVNAYLLTGTYPDEKQLFSSYDEIKDKLILGKEVSQRRDIGFFSDESNGYNYGKYKMTSQALTDNLTAVLDYVNESLATEFNGILINRYSPSDTIGAHSDDERNLDKIGVFSITVWLSDEGSSRTFRIKNKAGTIVIDFNDVIKTFNNKDTILDLETTHLYIMLMGGKDFQKLFTHEVPARLRSKGTRISYTFRKHTV